ncbi:biorientation Defective 1 isoform X2 [Musca autumnalis]|uniref:biorientation Defective 1 isoform X2 n=1 Tax=Musca autumnalis TaxID=221902 RepID=UPI003CF48FD7
MDASLVEKIVHEVKSQGAFDEFRKDSMADVDTKPAYQNLRQRVEKSVKKFLSEQTWTPEMNKNQLREKLRRHIAESGFLDVGVERIVDQVVNPKIGSVFQPRIEEIAYKYLGLPPPQKVYEPPPPPLMHPLPPLPLTAPPPPLKVETCSLLPNDLEQVSPDSDKATVKSEIDGDDKTEVDMDMEEKIVDDEESPPFEPLVTNDVFNIKQEEKTIKQETEESVSENNVRKYDDNNDVTVKSEVNELTENQSCNLYNAPNLDKDNNSHSMDCRNSQDSQLSSVSSDTRLTPEIKDDSGPHRTSQEEAVTANISEEAQMPKFSENSSEPSCTNGRKELDSQLHFDIKKDEIKFEGTERKKLDDSQISPLNDEIKCEVPSETSLADNRNDMFKFSVNTNSIAEQREEDLERTSNAQESSFGSSIDDSTSMPTNNTTQVTADEKDKEFSVGEKSPQVTTPKIPSTPTPTVTPTATPTATPTPPISQTSAATPSPLSTHRSDREHSSRHSSSSSKHKKHSKERRRSHDREKDRDRYRSSKDGKDRHHSTSSSSHKGNSKYSSSSSSHKHYSSSSYNRSTNDKDLERSHSSSKHAKHSSSSDKRHSLSSSHKDQSSSSSNTERSGRNEDDHYEAKQKPQRRKSTDSNDDDGDIGGSGAGGGGKSSHHQHQKTLSSSGSKSKSKYIHTSSTKDHDSQPKDDLPQDLPGGRQDSEYPKVPNNVVILNDLLENPETQCIQLDTRGHLIDISIKATEKPIATTENDDNKSVDLLYFEDDLQQSFIQRINILNETMDMCRKAVNSLRFDSPIDEGIELSSEDDYNHNRARASISSTLKRKSTINYEDCERTPQKRCPTDKNEENISKTSPTPSDLSVSSKENEEIDKNSDRTVSMDVPLPVSKTCCF